MDKHTHILECDCILELHLALHLTLLYIYIDQLHIIYSYWYYDEMPLHKTTIYNANLHSVDLDLQISKGEDNLKCGQIHWCN